MQDELHRTGTIGVASRTVGDAIEAFADSRPHSDYDDWALKIIREGLASVRLSALSVVDCDRFLTECAAGLSNRRPVGRDHLTRLRQRLVAVLRNEIRVGNLARNVAEVATIPVVEVEPKGRRALTANELHRVLEAAEGSRLIIVDLCGRNALRPAEARALRWSDLDLDCQELNVTGQLNRRNERTDVKRANNAARTILLDNVSVDRLKIWRDQQDHLQAQARSAWRELDLVASTGQGTPIDRHSLARSMRLICTKAGIDPAVTAYELRHTAISLQAEAGASAWEIADWAGTSEAMISRIYRHQLRRVSGLRPAHGGGLS